MSGEILDPMLMKNGSVVVSRWAWGFILGEEWISRCFHVVSCWVYVCDTWHIEIHSLESSRTRFVLLHVRPCRGLNKTRCSMFGVSCLVCRCTKNKDLDLSL